MIPKREILELRNEWGTREDVIEKDYVLGLLISVIAQEETLRDTWVFKGGTALRKCYYETYRFSEDLDFTIVDGGPEDPSGLVSVFESIAGRIYDDFGVQLLVGPDSFRRRRNRRGSPTTEGRIAFQGPLQRPQPSKIKLDLTSDEVLVRPAERRAVHHPYSDGGAGLEPISCYSIAELLAEKLRALAERCRPRDLYDVVNVYRHADLTGLAGEVLTVLGEKCRFAGIAVPSLHDMKESEHRLELEQEWDSMLAHQLPHPLPFGQFWNELPGFFDWLEGRKQVAILPRAERPKDALDQAWAAPRMMTTWNERFPLELVRYAGANRLKVLLDYYPVEPGRAGPRLVEPLSLRRARSGVLLLYVINDRGLLRSYRTDRIQGAKVTNETFQPKYEVEF